MMFPPVRTLLVFMAVVTVALPGNVRADLTDMKVYSPIVERGR